MVRSTLSVMAAVVLPLFAAGASAQEWFAGISVGQGKQQDYDITGPLTVNDDTDDSARIFGGYQFSPHQALVGSFIDLGELHFEGPAFGGFSDTLEAEGFDVSYVIGFAPGEQEIFRLFGTAGIFAWDQDVRLMDSTGEVLFGEEGTSFSFGLGAELNFARDGTSAWGVHIVYQNFKDVGDEDNSGQEQDVEVLSVGLRYGFGRNNVRRSGTGRN